MVISTVTTSYKVQCLPLTEVKKEKLLQCATEYARVYNFAARFLPSLPEKYYESTNPSRLYNKWITAREDNSQPLKSDILSGLQMLNAIKDACANFKTIKQLPSFEFKKAKKHMHIETPNIIKFENSEYEIVRTKSKTGKIHFGIAVGKKKKGKNKGNRELYLPLKTNTVENEEYRKAKGKAWGLIEYLEFGMKMQIAKKVRDKELASQRKEIKTINSKTITPKTKPRTKGKKAGLGIITYNLKENSISIPMTRKNPKFQKKGTLRTFIGINRGIRSSVALAAVHIDEHRLNKIKEYQEIIEIPLISTHIFNSLNNLGGKIIGVKTIDSSLPNIKKQWLGKINQKRQRARKEIGHRIRNITNTVSHQVSRKIVNFISKFKNPVVFFEDLSNIKEKKLRPKSGGKFNKLKRKMLSKWDYGNIKKKILYKLEAIGIWTLDVNPMYVSQICHKCGNHTSVRDSTYFKCERCNLGTIHNGCNQNKTVEVEKDAIRIITNKDAAKVENTKIKDAIRTTPMVSEDATIKESKFNITVKEKGATSIMKVTKNAYQDATIMKLKGATLNNVDTIGSNPINTIGQYNANINSSINIALRGLYSLYRYKEEFSYAN